MKSNRIIAINGESWCHTLTGIERLAIEVTQYLDELVQENQVELVLPANAENIPKLRNIKVVQLKEEAHFFPKWTQIAFQKYVILHHRISFDYTNTCPFFAPGFEFIHDLYQKLHPADFTSRRDKLIQFYSSLMCRAIAKRSREIFTVSEYTKQTIIDMYHVKPEKIHVVYSGVSGYEKIPVDKSIFDKFPQLKEKPFYFTIGSLSTRKNLKWIAEHASLYPNELFAVSGKPLPSVVPPELEKMKSLPNVIMTGYLSDGEVKAMHASCKAFILPTYFEGFGLPPLEALSCGAKVIISNRTSLPEIYGNCAYYIDPDKANVNLDELLSQKVESPEKILEKFTLKNTAQRIYDVIKSKGLFTES
ncbi:MAG: glycosyltransferase family 4 protein [Treponema sp.]|nr:glycosyltransferase family 4 protein [Treponema sp.]